MSGLQKNVSSQKWVVFAFDLTDGTPKTGDAANITAKISKDWGTLTASNDTNPTEQEDGYYVFDLTQAETNADVLNIYPESSTTDIQVVGKPVTIYTVPPNFADLDIANGAVEADVTYWNNAAIATPDTAGYPKVTIKSGTGTGEVNLSSGVADSNTVQVGGAAVTLATEFDANVVSMENDVITASAYDESTAFPVTSEDGGATSIAREGADGSTYTLSTLSTQVSQIGSGGGSSANEFALDAPNGFVITTGTGEVNDEDATQAEDGVLHQIDDNGGTLDVYYLFDITSAFAPANIVHNGRMNGNTDDVTVYVNTNTQASPTWVARGSILGSSLTVNTERAWALSASDVMVGADAGKVAVRFYGTGLSSATLSTDQIYVQKNSIASQVGYANGAIWIDTVNGTPGTVTYVNGTADNPVDSYADAETLESALGLVRFQIVGGSSLTIDGNTYDIDSHSFFGENWTLVGQNNLSMSDAYIQGAAISGTFSGSTVANLDVCQIGAATLPPFTAKNCGFGVSSGTLTAASDGEYIFDNCYSQVPGSGTPALVFTSLGASTGINNRGWLGGANYTLDSNCTVSHEVLAGGGQTFTTGGADVELRGLCRDVTFVLSGAGTIQTICTTGKYTISGAATTSVELNGTVSEPLADTSSGTSVVDNTIGRTNWLGGDYALNTTASGNIGIDWANVENPTSSVDLENTTIATTDSTIADAVWDEVLTAATHNIATSAGRRLRDIASAVIWTGDVVSATANTVTLDSTASSVDGSYDPADAVITEGTGAGQVRHVFEYFGTAANGNPDKTMILDRDWKVQPDATSKIIINAVNGSISTNEGQLRGGSTTTAVLNDLASSVDGIYKYSVVQFRAGAGQDQFALILDYDGPTKTAIFGALAVAVDATTTYQILPIGMSSVAHMDDNVITNAAMDSDAISQGTLATDCIGASELAASAINEIADGVLDELVAEHTIAGSLGQAVADIETSTGTTIPDAIDALNDITADEARDAVFGQPLDGKTFEEAMRYIAAILAGKISGAGTGTEVFLGLDGITTRTTVTVDANGNRTDVSYD